MMVIGSVAAKYWIKNFRNPKDIDLWIPRESISKLYNNIKNDILYFKPQKNKDKYTIRLKDNVLEIGLYDSGSSHDLIKRAQNNPKYINIFGLDFLIPGIQSLIAIKRSHLEFPINWEKHINDYVILKQNIFECNLEENTNLISEAYKLLHSSAESRYKKRKIQLSMSNDNFFKKSQAYVNRIYNHDDIHQAVAFKDMPMYTKIKINKDLAKCDLIMWQNLSYTDKIKTVQEEAFVIALERFILPNKLSSKEEINIAFNTALKKICTTLTSGWFRDFAIDNWQHCKNYDIDFVEKFMQALHQGRIRLYNPGVH